MKVYHEKRDELSEVLQIVSQLEAIVRELKTGDAVVLQVEPNEKLQYLAFEMD